MDEAGSAQKPDYVNGRMVSCAESRKGLKLGYRDAIKAMKVATIPVIRPAPSGETGVRNQ